MTTLMTVIAVHTLDLHITIDFPRPGRRPAIDLTRTKCHMTICFNPQRFNYLLDPTNLTIVHPCLGNDHIINSVWSMRPHPLTKRALLDH